ncbi:MAG: thiamine pyrophosphate-dependent enzyme [Candidatus Bathyarchaeia archaeon]
MSKFLERIYEEDLTVPGTNLCPGCGLGIALRYALNTLGRNTVLLITAGCTPAGFRGRVRVPGYSPLLENCVAPASGIKAGLDVKGIEMNVLAFMGDGGTDMSLGPLTGAAERGDPIIYVCCDNEAYMNTGIQRSGMTPYGAWTFYTPVGKLKRGKETPKKNVPQIVANAGAAYVATGSVAHLVDYARKVKRAEEVTKNDEGLAYIHVLSPCPTGWRFPSEASIKVARLAVQTGTWNLYEIHRGRLRMTYKPRERLPVKEYLALQRRFRHLTDEQVRRIQESADEEYARLESLTQGT